MIRVIEPFPNLAAAGVELAKQLAQRSITPDVIVVGIVSGGVPVAVEVANHLNAPLDWIILRRLLAPGGPGTQASVISVAGNLTIDEEVGPRPTTPQTPFEYFLEDALNSFELRVDLCRGKRPPLLLEGKTVLIVDCGIRTSLTMQAAISAVKRFSPARIIAAVPVTSRDGLTVQALVDEFVYLEAPEPFGNAGVWYKDFSRPNDEALSGLLSGR